MSFEPRDYLRHMLVEADYLMGQAVGLSFEVFADDDTRRRAFVRSHDYFGVDYELVWDVVQHRIPELRNQLASVLKA